MEMIKRETDYAIRTLILLARYQRDEHIPASRLSRDEKIPLDYSRKILQKLMKAGIVGSKEGNRGGYSLKRSLHAITLAEVISIFQGSFHLSRCLLTISSCPNKDTCKIRGRMIFLEAFLADYLARVTLGSLLMNGKHKTRCRKGKSTRGRHNEEPL